MMQKKANHGFVMLALMFLIALSVPLVIARTYFNLSNQHRSIARSSQYTMLKWATRALLNRAKFDLKNHVSTPPGLEDPMFTVNNNVTEVTNAVNAWLPTFQSKFNTFTANNGLQKLSALMAAQHVLPVSCSDCGIKVLENDLMTGQAKFSIKFAAQLSDTELANQALAMTESLSVSAFNLADYAVFYYGDFVTSPGRDTVYEGPIYVGGSTYFTPAKNKSIRLTFDTTDFDSALPKPFNLKTSGHFKWFAPRALGPKLAADTLNPYSYEVDVYGRPVFYYFSSNNELAGTNDSMIEVLDNSPENFDTDPGNQTYSKLIGASPAPSAPPLSYFERHTSDGLVPPSTIYTSKAQMTLGGAVVNSSTIYDPDNPSVAPLNPNWSQYLMDHFEVGSGNLLLEDLAPQQTLRIGTDDPYQLIELAQNEAASDTLRKVKLQWIARDASQNDRPFIGMSLDFRKYKCEFPPRIPATAPKYRDPTCATYTTYDGSQDENPADWDSGNNPDGFIHMASTRYISPGTFKYFYDMRRNSAGLFVIEIDVSKLKQLADHDCPHIGVNGQLLPCRDKPILLYIGLPDANFAARDLTLAATTEQYVQSGIGKPGALVRLINGEELPGQGLTVVTNGFLQIRGDYNTQGAPASCSIKPAAVLADQIMVLSNSFQDYVTTTNNAVSALAPATYTDPSDGYQYPSPTNSSSSVYGAGVFQSHPVRSQSNSGLEINALLATGMTPNFLMPVNSSLTAYFSHGPLTAIWQAPTPWRVLGSGSASYPGQNDGAYVNRERIKIENTMTDSDVDNMPVKIVTGYDANDVPIMQQIGTVNSLFNASVCPSCNGNIPLFLRVDASGNIMTSNIQENHIKPTELTPNFLNPYFQNTIPAGTRFAALSAMRPFRELNAAQPTLFPLSSSGCSVALQCVSDTNQSQACPLQNPVQCPNTTYCQTQCDQCDNGICGQGGEGCQQQTGACIQSTCQTCPDILATGDCILACPSGQQIPVVTPATREVIYSIGGYSRLYYSYSPNPTDYYYPLKNKYTYVPMQEPKFNGGHENAIRFAENWNQWTCDCPASPGACTNCVEQTNLPPHQVTLTGAVNVLWNAKTLSPFNTFLGSWAPWTGTTYSAPVRDYRYAKSFRNDECVPAGIPSTVQFKVEGYRQE